MICNICCFMGRIYVMDNQNSTKPWKWQVLFIVFLCSWGWVSGQLHYSIVEESEAGTLIGNVAQDLGLNPADISKRRMRLSSEGGKKYFAVNQENGDLTVYEKIDRERDCGSSSSCLLPLEIVVEQPLELFSVEIEIIDINDNSPVFSTSDQMITILEALAIPGTLFPLEKAQDLDIGSNGVSQYKLSASQYFTLSVKKRKDGTLVPELIIEKALDREENGDHRLIITALDSGKPPRSGTSQITVIILDSNDNAPMFDHPTYKVGLLENTTPGTIVVKLNATDMDDGHNGEIEYFFDYHTLDSVKHIFGLNQKTGEISIKGIVDFEENSFYEISIRAKDRGVPELQSRCLLLIEIEDVNDNTPEITITSMINEIPENAAVGTTIGFVNIKDKDAGRNGEVHLELSLHLPFKIKSFNNRYSIVTDGLLDREKVSQYILGLVATDLGSPPLSTRMSIILNISDINDNAPEFSQAHFNAFIQENNKPGTLLCTVSAFDLDHELNANLLFTVMESEIDGSSVSSFVYINSNTGNMYAQRSFDYEHMQVLQITVKAEDSGSPRLSSTVTVFIFISDENDNAPSILYPDYLKEFTPEQKVAKTDSIGSLVTKISAIDSDSGRNGWLLYDIIEATDPSLFQISAHTGEIRTLRQFQEIDNVEQKLVISVKDHGVPALSTTVIMWITLEDNSFQETHKTHTFLTNPEHKSDMTLYLIISLVAISLVSLVTFIILLARCLRDKNGYICCLRRPQATYYTEQCQPTLHLNTDGTLKYMEVRLEPPGAQGQCYKTCFPPSEKNDFTFARPLNFPEWKAMVNETEAFFPGVNGLNETNQQAQPNMEWRFSQAQRPGPSGAAQPTEETGVWPNNQFETERLQAMILASANEAAEGTSGLGGGTGTMGLSARYGPQFTLQHVPDYRQNVYIPGSTLTPTNAAGKRDGKSGNKKKSGKKEKK